MRSAEKSDCRTNSSLYRISSGGVVDYIWTSMAKPGEDILDIGHQRSEREEGDLSDLNSTVAALNDDIIKAPLAFPMRVNEVAAEEEMDLVSVP